MRTKIQESTKSELGEGPTYDREQNTARWFDIEGRVLFEHDFSLNQTTKHPLPMKASMLGVIDKTTQIIATEGGLFLRNANTGELALHQPIEVDNPVTRSND